MVTPRPFSSCRIVTKEKPRTGRGEWRCSIGPMRPFATSFQSTSAEADDMLCLGGFSLAPAGRADRRSYGHVSGAHEDAGRDQGDDAEQLPQHHRPPLMPARFWRCMRFCKPLLYAAPAPLLF